MEKRLCKSRTDKKIAGVCGGLGKYFNIDPTIVRIVCVILMLGYGVGLFTYVIAAFVIPEEPVENSKKNKDIIEAEEVDD